MRVQLLGPLSVTDGDDEEKAPPAPKERALLLLLGLRAGQAVQVRELVDSLWGEDPPRSAAKAVQTYVSSLRRSLGFGTIETTRGGYRLRVAPDDVDAVVFGRLVEEGCAAADHGDPNRAITCLGDALTLWRGEPLVELSEQPVGRAEASRLIELRQAAEDKRFTVRLALGGHEALVGELEAAVAAEPLREPRWCQLMLALYRCGRQADALRAYQRLRTTLADELGLEPSAESRALEAAVLAQDPGLALAPASAVETPTRTEPPGGRPLPSGNVTFLCSRVETSAAFPRRPGALPAGTVAEHRRVVGGAVAEHGGTVVGADGERCLAVFGDATQALRACVEAQQRLDTRRRSGEETVRARMGVHTGIAQPSSDGEYLSAAVEQVARIAAAAHGGQVLISAETAGITRDALVDEVAMVDRGLFLFAGFDEPARVFQLVHPELESSFPALLASHALPHNLPDTRTSFVGREADFHALDGMLRRSRLVTVVGPGGVGKTRLGIEVASRAAPSFEAGAHLCDLSLLTDSELVLATIAASLGSREWGSGGPLEAVVHALKGRRALLVVDNCEHLLASAAQAIDALLSAVRALTVLATSREPLGVSGEQIWRISPLEAPDPAADLPAVLAAESVRLFEDRARLAEPGFDITDDNAPDLVSICRQLDGLPLAIELAAAQVAAMPPRLIADRLGDHAQLLATGRRRATGRHRTLDATVDWSYQLLDEPERRLLRMLSVFAGGFTVDAVQAVAGADDELATLVALVDKSLVLWDPDAGRYRLLETIRAHARARLVEAEEADAAATALLVWCTTFAEPVEAVVQGRSEGQAYELVEREIGNLHAAMTWAAERRDPEGLRLVVQLRSYWHYRAAAEGRYWCRRLLEAIPQARPLDVGRAYAVSSFCASQIGEPGLAVEDADRAVAVLESAGYERALLTARMMRATLRVRPDDVEACRAEHLEVRDRAAELGDATLEAAVLINLAGKEVELGDPAAACEHGQLALAILAELDCPPRARVVGLLNLGSAMLANGSPRSSALALFGEALDYLAELRSPVFLVASLQFLAQCLACSEPERAARLLGAAIGLRESHRITPRPIDTSDCEQVREALEQSSDAATVLALMDSSSRVTVDEAVELVRTALSDGRTPRGDSLRPDHEES